VSPFLALVHKDLVLYFTNRRAVIMSVVAPIAIAAFFGYLFGDHGNAPSRIPVAITDQDTSDVSKRLVTLLHGEASLEVTAMPADAARAAVVHGKARAAILLPAGFGRAVTNALFRPDQRPVIEIRYDPSQAMALAVVRGMLAQYTIKAVAESVLGSGSSTQQLIGDARASVMENEHMGADQKARVGTLLEHLSSDLQALPQPAANASGATGAFELPFTITLAAETSGANTPYNGYAHSFGGMGVQFILFMGIEMGVGLLLSRRMGLWKRLRAAPISRALLIGSRIASGALTAIILFLIIFAAGFAFFGVRVEGSVAGFAGVIIAFAFLTASFGLLVAALGRTPEATRGLAIFATLIMVMLGGAWVPTFVFPQWLQEFSKVVPTRWAVDGLDAMTWRGLGFESAVLPIVVMLGFAVVFSVLALSRFDWDE